MNESNKEINTISCPGITRAEIEQRYNRQVRPQAFQWSSGPMEIIRFYSEKLGDFIYFELNYMRFGKDKERPITAVLQDFPSTYRFFGNKLSRCQQIADAAPPSLMRAIASQIYATQYGVCN